MTIRISADNCKPDPGDEPLLIQRESLTLRQKACDILRKAITDHRFPPGTRLIERDLCEQLGVSRTSVREALRHLESEHLIEMVPYKGPVVATLSVEEVREIYDVRAALEGLACEKFAVHATNEHLEQLDAAVAKMELAARQDDHREILETKAEFYRIIFDGSNSTIGKKLVHSLMSRIEVLRRMSLASDGRSAAMIEEVRRIAEAAHARDAMEMKTACSAHLKSALDAVIPQLSGNQAETESSQR